MLDVSSAIGLVEVTELTLFSFALPPRYVEYRISPGVELNLVMKASKPPPFVAWSGSMVGKLVDDVKPVR